MKRSIIIIINVKKCHSHLSISLLSRLSINQTQQSRSVPDIKLRTVFLLVRVVTRASTSLYKCCNISHSDHKNCHRLITGPQRGSHYQKSDHNPRVTKLKYMWKNYTSNESMEITNYSEISTTYIAVADIHGCLRKNNDI